MGKPLMTDADSLLRHPHFKVTKFPRLGIPVPQFEKRLIVRWALENVAACISPPKVDGEDDEFACGDVAKMCTNGLRALLERKIPG